MFNYKSLSVALFLGLVSVGCGAMDKEMSNKNKDKKPCNFKVGMKQEDFNVLCNNDEVDETSILKFISSGGLGAQELFLNEVEKFLMSQLNRVLKAYKIEKEKSLQLLQKIKECEEKLESADVERQKLKNFQKKYFETVNIWKRRFKKNVDKELLKEF